MTSAEKPVGRPPHAPTRKTRTSVARMRACGDSKDTIARAIGIDRNTLDKHYPEELTTGAARARRDLIDWMFAGAKKGNASLQKRLEEMSRMAGALDEIAGDDEADVKAPKLGKKEVVRQQALAAGSDSDWGEDLTPPADQLN